MVKMGIFKKKLIKNSRKSYLIEAKNAFEIFFLKSKNWIFKGNFRSKWFKICELIDFPALNHLKLAKNCKKKTRKPIKNNNFVQEKS